MWVGEIHPPSSPFTVTVHAHVRLMRASKDVPHGQEHARPGTRARPGVANTSRARASMRTKPWRTAHTCKRHARAGRRPHCPQPRRSGEGGPQQHAAACRVCARDWRGAGGGGGSGSILRTRDSIRGGAGCGERRGFEEGIAGGEILLLRHCSRRRPRGQGRRVGGGKGQGRELGLKLWLRRGCGRGHAKGRAVRGKGGRTRRDWGRATQVARRAKGAQGEAPARAACARRFDGRRGQAGASAEACSRGHLCSARWDGAMARVRKRGREGRNSPLASSSEAKGGRGSRG